MILRGVTTITMNNDGKPMTMTGAIRPHPGVGRFNVQQIRLEGCRLGLLPPCKPRTRSYMDKLESWVKMGEERGIYTVFKVTTYDIPGLELQRSIRQDAWDNFGMCHRATRTSSSRDGNRFGCISKDALRW